MVDTKGRKYIQPIIDKAAKAMLEKKVTANQVTILAAFIGVGAGVALALEVTVISVILLWLSGFFDVVDGSMARLSKTSSPLGTLMDVVFDRAVEISVLMAMVYVNQAMAVYVAIVLACVILSMTVFLTVGALADKKGEKSFYYQPGLAERTEGFIMLTLCIILPDYRGVILLAFAAMIFYTAIQRFVEAVRFFKH